MKTSEEIKNYLYDECDMDLAGIADATLLEAEPEGHRPSDILPGAKSVVVFGKSISDGSIQTVFRHFEDGNKTARGSYTAYGADLAPNFSLFFASFDLAKHIEKLYGYPAAPLPCGSMQCGDGSSVAIPGFAAPYRVGLPLDIEKAALACGLGEYGWSGRLLTKSYGPRVHFGAVVTQLETETDEPYDGEELCLGEACRACAKICPATALTESSERIRRISVGREKVRSIEVADVKLNRCITAACALRKEFGGEEDFAPADPSDEELERAFKEKPLNNFEGLDHYPKWRCDKCLVYCRAGNWEEKFATRGLSTVDSRSK